MSPALATALLLASVPAGWGVASVVRVYAPLSKPETLSLIVASVATTAWVLLTLPFTWVLPVTIFLGWSLLALGMTDACVFRLPDPITLPLIAAGLVVSYLLPERDLVGHAVGAAIGFGVFLGVMVGFQRVRKHEGLGLGDAKLAAAAGAWLGWQALPYMILVACAAGFIWIGVAVLRRGKEALHQQIPFGIPLSLAIWLIWLYGIPQMFGYVTN